ncbi:MAG: recombination protein O N-terminal domain-containing protein, partial [Bacteroidia bacterium]|nr:recombination protein O N-terminal domain-containing protein [Bacteroidia bacterium]
MQVKDKAIVLQCTKYDDKKYILKLFTELHGLVTAFARVSSKSSSKIKKASILPLTQIDVEL